MLSFKQYLNKKVLTPEEIAKKHKVHIDVIHAELKRGIKVEHEHTKNHEVARRIALAHLGERHDYYKRLAKAEKK